jgi:cysteinyl-tRNA synthetase
MQVICTVLIGGNMQSTYWFEYAIEEAQNKIKALKEELLYLNSMKVEVSNGADTMQGQIESKRKASSDLLMLESRLPLVCSLNEKVQNNIDDTFRYKILTKFDDVNDEVKSTIKKVENEIEIQNDIINSNKSAIIRIRDEERREAEKREADKIKLSK